MRLNKSIAFRVDFNVKIGLGHIYRCLNLAEILRKRGWSVIFICRKFNEKQRINFRRFKVFFINKELNEENDGKITKNLIIRNSISVLLIDRDHFLNKKNKKQYILFLKEVRKLNLVFAWEPFIFPNFSYDYIYHPYIGSDKLIKKKTKNIIQGEKYLVINDKFFSKRTIKKEVKNILINLGGADNSKILVKVIKNLFIFKNKIKINMISFLKIDKKNLSRIKKIAKDRNLKINFIINPKKIYELYKKADIGIVGSGYSKYEASASGLPILIVQKKKSDFFFNKFFNKKKSSLLIKNIDKNKDILLKLINNFEERKKISKNGSNILNKKNSNKISKIFENILK